MGVYLAEIPELMGRSLLSGSVREAHGDGGRT